MLVFGKITVFSKKISDVVLEAIKHDSISPMGDVLSYLFFYQNAILQILFDRADETDHQESLFGLGDLVKSCLFACILQIFDTDGLI
jgi:hypothetical protein